MNNKKIYGKNRAALSVYPFFKHILPIYEDLKIKNENLPNGELPIKIERTNTNSHPFFRDLSKPLLLKNEFNTYNIEYVEDNVRRSEDFGGDNHIYLYYDNFDYFSLLLQCEDITPYLKNKKLVFIFGEEELTTGYPIDFKKEYGIDYNNMTGQPIRIDEIKRIFVHWHNNGYSGNVFWSGVLDFHKNLLTIKTFGLVGFSYIYKKLLKNKTVDEVYSDLLNNENFSLHQEFTGLFNSSYSWGGAQVQPVPKIKDFFYELSNYFTANYKPSKIEWFKGMFLAYANSIGRDLNARIAPAIVFHTHYMSVVIHIADNYDIFDNFKYFRCISILRRNTICMASSAESAVKNSKFYNPLQSVMGTVHLNWQNSLEGYSMPLYMKPSYKYLPYIRVVRFEDLKLEPKATLEAILDFFDFPWDDSLMHTTANGVSESLTWLHEVKDFDPSPAIKKREKLFSPFDYYRIELVTSKMYEPWGYKPQYYTDGKKYTNEKILELFKKPFKCESLTYTYKLIKENEELHKQMLEFVKERLSRPVNITKDGEKLIPVPWLKPKKEFMQGKLYE